MKLVTFEHQNRERIGAVNESGYIVDLERAYARYLTEVEGNPNGEQLAPICLGREMCEFLKRGEKSLAVAQQAVAFAKDNPACPDGGFLLDRAGLRLKSPVPRPGALISAGKNFSDHVAEMTSKQGPLFPVAFLKLPGTVVGPEDDIPYPQEVSNLDYEVELAIVIGRPCFEVNEEEALECVAGYSVFNDISARDVIRAENKSGIHLMGKSFPGFAPMGPYLVTKDEIPDPQNLKLRLSVNGEVRQDSSLSYMIFKIRRMIAYWSQLALNPGDVITTGTPRGVAAGRKPGETPWWLRPGDIVEAEVESVGSLRNRIVPE